MEFIDIVAPKNQWDEEKREVRYIATANKELWKQKAQNIINLRSIRCHNGQIHHCNRKESFFPSLCLVNFRLEFFLIFHVGYLLPYDHILYNVHRHTVMVPQYAVFQFFTIQQLSKYFCVFALISKKLYIVVAVWQKADKHNGKFTLVKYLLHRYIFSFFF